MKMKKKLLIFSVLLTSFICCNDNQIFKEANALYSKESFEKALNLYNSITLKSSECWFNLGNCYYKLNKFSLAIASWKKALKGASNEDIKDLEFNLLKAKEKLSIEEDNNLFGEIYNFIVKCLNLMPIIYFQIILLTFWYLFFLIIAIKRKFNLILCSLFVCNFFLLGCLGIKHNEQNNNKKGIIIEKISVYAGPNKDYHIIGTLNLAEEVKINHKDNEWCKVSNNKLTGWVLSGAIFIL